MSAPARVTQSALLVMGSGHASLAQSPVVTQALAMLAGSGDDLAQGPIVTQALTMTACSGDPDFAQSALVTQSAALVLCTGDPTLPRSPLVTQAALLVAAPSPAPCNVTQANSLVACTGHPTDTLGARVTQSNVLVLCDADAPTTGVRLTQATTLVGHTGTPAARLTQAALLACTGPSCPDTRAGIRSAGLRELTNMTLGLLGEDPQAPDYWTRSEIADLLNDAQMAFARETKVLESIETFTTEVGTTEYELSSRAMQIKRVLLENWRIPPRTTWELDRTLGNWQGQSNGISNYVQRSETIVQLDQAPVEAEDLEVWTISLPTPMTDACDDPGWPTWSHRALGFMAASRALNKAGEQQDRATAAVYEAIGNDYVTLMSAFVSYRDWGAYVH